MHTPFVRINQDSAQEIATLYGVDPTLAQRIVDDREAHGPFQGPEELVRVPGVSPSLAEVLAPHIDWQVAVEPEGVQEREWLLALAWMVALATFSWIVTQQALPTFHASIDSYRSGSPQAWLGLWINGSILAALSCAMLFILARIVQALCRNPQRARQSSTMAVRFMILAMLFVLSTGLGNALYYQAFSPSGWHALFRNKLALGGLVASIGSAWLFIPILVVFWRPALASNARLAQVYDIGLIVAAGALGLMAWFQHPLFPLWVLTFWGVIGLFAIAAGIYALRTGQSIFHAQLGFLDRASLARQAVANTAWLKWLNMRLPDPEQQQALKQALQDASPTSKIRTIGAALLIGLGGWLVITACGGVVEWVVQQGLESVFKGNGAPTERPRP